MMDRKILCSVKDIRDLISAVSDESKICIVLEDDEFEIQVLDVVDNKKKENK
jgi:hypothetical protein